MTGKDHEVMAAPAEAGSPTGETSEPLARLADACWPTAEQGEPVIDDRRTERTDRRTEPADRRTESEPSAEQADAVWLTAGAHDLVRPFIMTGGRTRGGRPEIRIETLIERVDPTAAGTVPEETAILDACTKPTSVAEIGAYTNLSVGVVAILAGDLLDAGVVRLHSTEPADIEVSALSRMIEHVRAL